MISRARPSRCRGDRDRGEGYRAGRPLGRGCVPRIEQGFAIDLATSNELFEFLGTEYPFVTSDQAFHAYASTARAALAERDALVVAPRLAGFCRGMLVALRSRAAAGDLDAGAAAAYFAVPVALLDGEDPRALGLSVASAAAVGGDLGRIRAHARIEHSAVLGRTEDFTKYAPRGRFSMGDGDPGYFQAVVFLGRATFRATDERETRLALAIAEALRSRPALLASWRDLDGLLGACYGPNDDATPADAVRAIEGIDAHDAALAALRRSLASVAAPRIHTAADTRPSGAAERAGERGMRVLGQRYTRGAHRFQQALESGVWPLTSLGVVGDLMGSRQAVELARERGWRVIDAAPAAPAGPVTDLPEATLQTLGALFIRDARAPAFMRGPAWEEKQINTALGGWAEIVDLTAPFAKEANICMGLSPATARFHGYVEPVPVFFARLDSMCRSLRYRLDRAGLFEAIESSRERTLSAWPEPARSSGASNRRPLSLSATLDDWRERERVRLIREFATLRPTRDVFDELSGILAHCGDLAHRELAGESQTIEDGIFLKSLGRRFKSLAFNRSNMGAAMLPMGIVTDLATEYQSGQCLEVGTGLAHVIYVAVPDGDHAFVCRGAVYAYHEFTQPGTRRLDHASWRRMLRDGTAPSPWLASRALLRWSAGEHPVPGPHER